jgi:small-conductance mechanosensitive channel
VGEFATSLGLSVNQAKAVISIVAVVGLLLVRWLALRVVHGRVKDEEVWYRTRKVVTYVAFILIVLSLVRIWVVPFGDLATFLGLVSAGIAVALADVLKDIVGWAYILARRPFRVGDRIETKDYSGDVIDIRLFRFTIMEIGNWVYGDHSTGRIVHIPNQIVFTTAIANYTEGFEFLWHEIPILVTFESDWKRAEAIIRDIIEQAVPDVGGEALKEIRRAARAYRIKYGQLTPTVYVSVRDSGIQLTARVLVPVRRRRDVDQSIWRAVLDAFAAEPGIALAYPTVRTYLQGPIHLDSTSTPEPGSGV